jgi:hypothetical protein
MSNWVFNLILLAQQSRYHSLGNRFRGRRARLDPNDLLAIVTLVVVIALAVYLLSRLVKRLDRTRSFNSPRRLFRDLCRAHGLDRRNQRLLAEIAAGQSLEQPAHLFLDPGRFDKSQLSERLHARLNEVQQIRDRLFAQQVADET